MRIPLLGNWAALSLASQFALAGGVVMLLAALAVGAFVADRVEEVVVRNTANSTALYMESFIGPITQDLARQDYLSATSQAEIARLLSDTALGKRVASFKIWYKGGLVVGASDPALVGQHFEPTENLARAWQGDVRASFDDTEDSEDAGEHALGLPLLEIYSPIRGVKSGQVIAVAEFYEISTGLQQDLQRARALGWLSVVTAMALIGASLFAIVLRGSRTIDRHVAALSDLATHNLALRLRVQSAAGRFSSEHDRNLRRIGADLHDGPAQLMGFAALRLDALRGKVPDRAVADELATVHSAVSEAMTEIRNIARGLSLPDIDHQPLQDILRTAVDKHRARTATEVRFDMTVDTTVPSPVKVCCLRFVQEGLNNAWRHGGGRDQKVVVRLHSGVLRVEVLDGGPGLTDLPAQTPSGLGLRGLSDRIESLGGSMRLENRMDGPGARLWMELDLKGTQ